MAFVFVGELDVGFGRLWIVGDLLVISAEVDDGGLLQLIAEVVAGAEFLGVLLEELIGSGDGAVDLVLDGVDLLGVVEGNGGVL